MGSVTVCSTMILSLRPQIEAPFLEYRVLRHLLISLLSSCKRILSRMDHEFSPYRLSFLPNVKAFSLNLNHLLILLHFIESIFCLSHFIYFILKLCLRFPFTKYALEKRFLGYLELLLCFTDRPYFNVYRILLDKLLSIL